MVNKLTPRLQLTFVWCEGLKNCSPVVTLPITSSSSTPSPSSSTTHMQQVVVMDGVLQENMWTYTTKTQSHSTTTGMGLWTISLQ